MTLYPSTPSSPRGQPLSEPSWQQGIGANFQPESTRALREYLRSLGVECVVLPEFEGERIADWMLELVPAPRVPVSLWPSIAERKYRLIRWVLEERLIRGSAVLGEYERTRSQDDRYEELFALFLTLLSSYELAYPLAESEMDRAVSA